MVELEHHRIGLQVGLTGHKARCKAFLPHPGDDGAHTLYGHIVVVAAMLDEVFLCQVGLPAVHEIDLLQLRHQGLGLRCLKIHIGRLQQIVQRVFHADTKITQCTLAFSLDKRFNA